MKVKPIYHKDFINFLHTPESDEEYAAMVAMALRSKQVETLQRTMQETIKELERKTNHANL